MKKPSLEKASTVFLQIVVALIGAGALAFMLWEPHLEGRNAHATPFEIYFKDPFLAYAYLSSTLFFTALYQTFKVLGCIGRDKTFYPATVKALRTIKYCASALIGCVGLALLFIMSNTSDDRAGGVVLCLLAIFGSAVVAAAAAMLERVLQDGMDRGA